MVLSNKKLKQKLRAAKAELIVASEARNNLIDKKNEKPGDIDSKASIMNLEARKARLSKREKRRQKVPKENAEVNRNGEMSGDVEPNKQDLPNSDPMQETKKKKKRKRDDTEASENVNEKKPKQLKKNKKKQNKKKPKEKVENGKVKEEGADRNESGCTGAQHVVKTNESIERKNVETSSRVYVGGIPYYSTEDDIRSFFEGCGTITSVDCMTFADSGKFRGIAIINFKTEAAAKRALALDGSDMGGLFLKIQPFKSARANKLPDFSPSVLEGYNRIYIGNLAWDITEDDVKKLFSDCSVTSIRFGEDKETGEFKGYAHVDFADSLSLKTALKLDQTVLCGRPVKISCAVPKKGIETKSISTPRDNQENGGNEGNAAVLETQLKHNKIDSGDINVVVENQVASSGTDVSSKIRRRTCYECGERGHLSSSCPKKLAADDDSTIPGDNQEGGGKKENSAVLAGQPKDNNVDSGDVSIAVENQAAGSGTNVVSSKIRRRTCYECGERGHLSSSCPKKLAADDDSTIPRDNQEGGGKKENSAVLAAQPKDNNVDSGDVSIAVENQAAGSGTSVVSSKIRRRTCYECGERGHLSSSCPKKLAADGDSTNPGTT